MDLLVDARHAREQRRLHTHQLGRRAQRIGQECDREADVRRREMQQAPVVVGEREVEEHHVAGLRQAIFHLVALLHHRVVVAVADHARLRRAGRSRRVDEGEQVVLVDRVRAFVERRRLLRREGTSAGAQFVELRERDHVLERQPCDLRPLVVVLDERADSVRVLEHVLRVARRAVRVDRRPDGSDQAEGEVEERPLERRPAEERERCTLLHAEGEQAVRQLVDRLGRLGPGDLAPLAVDLVQVRSARAALGRRVAPQIRDRPRARRHLRRM